MELTGKHIVITGGTSGIGREVVRRLHAGNRLAVIARDPDKLATLATEHEGIVTVRADLARLEDVERAAAEVGRAFDRVDVLINNAAVQHTPAFIDDDFRYETIAEEITLNFTAVCALTSLLLPALKHGGPAAVVNVNSGLALAPKTGSAVYCATKGAMDIFSRSLRYQLEDTNIRVLQAFMPLVDTAMTAGRGSGKLSADDAAAQMIQGIEKDIDDLDIGKVKILRVLMRIAPALGRRVMRRM